MKRTPRSASSRGSIRRSVTWSIEKRKPRCASAARCSVSVGPRLRNVACLNSSTNDGASARLASRKSRHCAKVVGIAERRRGDVAEHADILVAHHQPAQHLHAAQHHHVVDPSDQPGGFRDRDEIVGGENLVLVVAQPRHRLVEAHLALRQRHHRLQIDVDAVFLDRVFHGGEDLRLAARGRGLAAGGSRRCRDRRRRDAAVSRGQRRLAFAARCPAWTGAGAAAAARPRPACRHGWRPRPRAA